MLLILMVVEADNILSFLECLNAPLSKARTEVNLGIVTAIPSYKPEATDLRYPFRSISLLNFDSFSRFP